MISKKLAAFTLAAGVALSGAYAASAIAAPSQGGALNTRPGKQMSTPAPGTKAAAISDMDSDKPTYAVGDNYTVTVSVQTNTDGNYTVGYSKVTGATCQGSGSIPVSFTGVTTPQTKKVTFTCRVNSFPVNGQVTLTTPEGVTNLTPSSPYTIGGSLPSGTATPTKAPTSKAPTTKPSTGGLAKTGV
ncbi:hypothetical protein CGZ93_15725 [Enemella dayhoffiae]|uniref:Uncharacterized protein n=1 Tax=Enemella dayhoffiae TaxID=2016507 RepID=A0A255GRL8_9ACTN|nr:hypothetical protein [Enemella dayhoffiae]OYO18428.1 hypothetical protein CGZ93_15725 [Enemella dayhoffiae]